MPYEATAVLLVGIHDSKLQILERAMQNTYSYSNLLFHFIITRPDENVLGYP